MAIINKIKDSKSYENVEKNISLHTVGRSKNWYSHYRKQYGGSSII
jgi:hypothetical protein